MTLVKPLYKTIHSDNLLKRGPFPVNVIGQKRPAATVSVYTTFDPPFSSSLTAYFSLYDIFQGICHFWY
jgi:hypothetical protein